MTSGPTIPGERLARVVVRRRASIAAAWAVLAALLLPHARSVGARLDASVRVPGSESELVARQLASRFASPFARTAVLVVTGGVDPRTPNGEAELRRLRDAAAAVPGVTRTLSHLDAGDDGFVGAGGATFVLVGLSASGPPADVLVPRLRAGTGAAVAALAARVPRAEVLWTGEDALNYDLRRASAADVARAERRAMPLTLALLLLAFGAVAASTIPLAVGGLAIALALGAVALAARAWPLTIALQNVVSMLGLALGVDYTLLLVSRFREARRAGRSA